VDTVLTKPITNIVNVSITSGIVCNQLKSALLTYVSLLCIISKICERPVHWHGGNYLFSKGVRYRRPSNSLQQASIDEGI
jgi:hypothetical protein